MTREEATIKHFEGLKKRYTKTHNGVQCGYVELAIAALRGPVPDPITGLVPCGCGGTPVMLKCESHVGEEVWIVMCSDCHVSTAECFYELAAKNDWNISHGYRA